MSLIHLVVCVFGLFIIFISIPDESDVDTALPMRMRLKSLAKTHIGTIQRQNIFASWESKQTAHVGTLTNYF